MDSNSGLNERTTEKSGGGTGEFPHRVRRIQNENITENWNNSYQYNDKMNV
jgi:hypothetical protein